MIMAIKKLLFPGLLVCTALALVFRRVARPAPLKSSPNHGAYDSIDAFIEKQMRRLSIPGASFAIVAGDQIVHCQGLGQARPGGEAPTPQTPFFIGSLTKSITATAVMQLVEAGQIVLDAPVQRYLPWFLVADAKESAQMTVRHLLNQTSGLPMSAGMVTLRDFDRSPNAAERHARTLATLGLAHPVGTVCEYCNLNYDLLGLIIETASGETYPSYIQSHILTPLGMSHTYTSKAAAQPDGLAVGHRYWFGLPVPVRDLPVPEGSLASGQLISTAEDMTHYLIAHLNGGRYGGVQILSEAGIAEMHHGVAEYVKFGVSSGRYGMGWFVDDASPVKTLTHGGNVPDFSAYMGLLPEQKKGMILLINADHYGLPPILAEVGWGATALLAGQPPTPVRLGFMPWLMRALLLIPLLQIVDVLGTLHLVRRWRQDPHSRPSQGRFCWRHILLPLIPNLSLAAFPIYLWASKMLGFYRLFMPDLAWIAMICGGFAGIWAFLRTGLLLRIQR